MAKIYPKSHVTDQSRVSEDQRVYGSESRQSQIADPYKW